MIARYVPSIIVLGVALAAYRLLGIGELFEELIKPKHLQPSYDYIIGIRFFSALYKVVVFIYCSLSARLVFFCIGL